MQGLDNAQQAPEGGSAHDANYLVFEKLNERVHGSFRRAAVPLRLTDNVEPRGQVS